MTQLHGLETVQITLVPAGTAASNPPTNPVKFQNIMAAMPEPDGGRNYAGGATGTFVAHTSSRKSSEGGKMPLTWNNLTWNDMFILSEMVMEGGIVPTGVGPYTSVHDGQSTSDDLARLTIQAGGSEGKLQMLNSIVSKCVISGDAKSGAVGAKLDAVGSEPTVAASLVTPVSYTPGAAIPFGSLVDIFVDDTAGGIGTTQLECAAVKSFQLTWDNKVSYVDTTCGRQYGRDKRYVEMQLRLLLEDNVWAEVADYLADALRYIRLYVPDAASPTHSWTFDMAGYWEPFSWGQDGPFRDITLTAWSELDDTLGFDWKSTLLHGLADAPNYQS